MVSTIYIHLLTQLYHKNQNSVLIVCDPDEEMSGMEEKMIVVMCFWILNKSVYRINCPVHVLAMFSHLHETQTANGWSK